MSKKFVVVFFLFAVFVFFVFTPSSFATSFDLIPPTGNLQQGQDITFTINIDTEGASITSVQSGLTFDSTLLQYVSVTAGAAMNTVVADTTTYGAGKVLFDGTNNTGYNGAGVFATVVFKIIAQSSGSTQICTLWLPQPTAGPTAVPTIPGSTPIPTIPGSSPAPTLPPQPTALPVTGSSDSRNIAGILAFSFFVATGGVFYLSQKEKYIFPTERSHSSESKAKRNIK